jgi:hypothetical protein
MNLVPCLDSLNDFVKYCNDVKLFDKWFNKWIDNGFRQEET